MFYITSLVVRVRCTGSVQPSKMQGLSVILLCHRQPVHFLLQVAAYGHVMTAAILRIRASHVHIQGKKKTKGAKVLSTHLSLYKEKRSFPEVPSWLPLPSSWRELCHIGTCSCRRGRECKCSIFLNLFHRKWQKWGKVLGWPSCTNWCHLPYFIHCAERLYQGCVTLTLDASDRFSHFQIRWRGEGLIPFLREALA